MPPVNTAVFTGAHYDGLRGNVHLITVAPLRDKPRGVAQGVICDGEEEHDDKVRDGEPEELGHGLAQGAV